MVAGELVVDGASVVAGADRLTACSDALSHSAASFRSAAGDLSAFGLVGRLAHAQTSVGEAMGSLAEAVTDFSGLLQDAAASMRLFATETAAADERLAGAAGGS